MHEDDPDGPRYKYFSERGWPLTFEWWLEAPGTRRYEFDWPALALNMAACVLLLFFAAQGIEWGTRPVSRGRRAPIRAAHEHNRYGA